jgi:hypothetical protein
MSPADREALERFLLAPESPPLGPSFDRALRDPFVASAEMQVALSPAPLPPAAAAESAVAGPANAPAALPFSERHKLEGVVAGQTPLALVDGRALRIGALLDGHRLIRIERDRVEFDLDGESAILKLPARTQP